MRTLLTILLLVIFFIALQLNNQVNSLKKQNAEFTVTIDSLKNEVFIHSTNETRYEIAWETLMTEYKECGEKYDEIMRNIE